MHPFSGIWVPLITPFTPNGQIDFDTLRDLVAELRDAEIAGLVVFGTTGEPTTLSDEEKQRVLACVLAECGSMRIVVGASGITADDVCDQLVAYESVPSACALVTPPYYVRPSQQAIVEFFRDVASRTTRSIIVYDVPYRTGVHMDLDTLQAIARLPSVVAIKDCGGDARKSQALIADRRLAVLSGEDHLIFTTVVQGGAGAIAASAHLHPRLFVAMYRALTEGRLEDARVIHHALAPMVQALFSEPNPAPLKAVLAMRGRGHAMVRRPLLEASADASKNAWEAYSHVADIAARVL